MKKAVYIAILYFIFSLLFVACDQTVTPENFGHEKNLETKFEEWEKAIPFPYSGYICDYQGNKPLIQFQILFPKGSSPDISIVRKAYLSGNDIQINCENIFLSSFVEHESYTTAVIGFNVDLSQIGIFDVNKFHITLARDINLQADLGNITFVVEEDSLRNDLSWESFPINQESHLSFNGEFKNVNRNEILIKGISYPNDMFEEIIQVSMFERTDPYSSSSFKPVNRNQTIIRPNEIFLLVFELSSRSNYFSSEKQKLLLMQPFLIYEVDKAIWKMPISIQPVVVQPNQSDVFLDEIAQEQGFTKINSDN